MPKGPIIIKALVASNLFHEMLNLALPKRPKRVRQEMGNCFQCSDDCTDRILSAISHGNCQNLKAYDYN